MVPQQVPLQPLLEQKQQKQLKSRSNIGLTEKQLNEIEKVIVLNSLQNKFEAFQITEIKTCIKKLPKDSNIFIHKDGKIIYTPENNGGREYVRSGKIIFEE